jgi:4-amino-4-deoxy-L-arabinose transferase-like glycosyltransferase
VTDLDTTLTVDPHAEVRHAPRRQLGAQATAMSGQIVAGVGNLGFALAAGRILPPGEFAMLAAFLAVYLLVHVPSASLGAGAALEPSRADSVARRLAGVGAAAGVVLMVLAAPVGGALNLTLPMVVALAFALPAAGALGLRRGALYGTAQTATVATSLAAEPLVRLGLGVPLLILVGPVGGAVAVVAGGWAGLALTRGASSVAASGSTPGAGISRRTAFTAATFFAFALVANQDLLVANAVLSPADAGAFAVLSVIGSAVAFGTATIPMVLLPAAGGHADTAPTRLALGLTAVIGVVSVLLGATLTSVVIGTAFGTEHLHVGHLLAPYLGAMALLALARVLAAHHCANGRGRTVAVVVGAVVIGHLATLVMLTRAPGTVVAATLVATAVACLAMFAVPSIDRATRDDLAGRVRRSTTLLSDLSRRPDVALVVAATSVAVVLRLLLTRGLWVDEAISVAQAQLSLSRMIEELRWSDVHPPLHHLVLWITVRLGGTGELMVRLPSILAGAALVPVVYLLGRDLYGRHTARIAAFAAALAPFLVWYSQEARMYSLFMLAATAAVLGQVRVMRSGSAADWVLYSVATIAMAWTQYFAIIPMAVQQAAFLGFIWHRRREPNARRLTRAWVISVVAIVLAVAPIAPIAFDQFENYLERSSGLGDLSVAPAGHGPVDTSSAHAELSVYSVVANGVWAMWGYHADGVMIQIAALWPLGMLAALAVLGQGRSRDTTLLVALIAVPAITLFVAGTFKRDLFELRYFSGAVPLAVLLAARVATRLSATTAARTVLGGVLLLTLSIGLLDQQLNGTNPRRYDFDGALNSVHATWEPGDVLLYEPLYLSELVDYYGAGLDSRPIGDLASPSVARASTVYVLVTERVINEQETAARIGDALARLQQEGRDVVGRVDHPNVTVWELR